MGNSINCNLFLNQVFVWNSEVFSFEHIVSQILKWNRYTVYGCVRVENEKKLLEVADVYKSKLVTEYDKFDKLQD